jgi:uncharacterized protein (TIGR01777 family)
VRVAVVGATGLIGRRLVAALASRGDDVLAISRGGREVAGARPLAWEPRTAPFPAAAREAAEAVVNLAGEPLAQRWTDETKRAIVESRVRTTSRIAEAVGDGGPGVLVNGSAVGIYGSTERPVDEAGPRGAGFLADTAVAWEEAARAAEARGARVACVRTGFVLAADGGGLPKLVAPARLGAGGPIGGGRQWISWIHVEDEVGILLWALDTPSVRGPVNAVAPNPVRQRDLAAALGRVLGRPALVPTPSFAPRLLLGEAATVILEGQRVVPRVAQEGGYRFAFTEVEPALRDLLEG